MRICLFALTGFGNTVLSELLRDSIVDKVVAFTRKECGQFPYYDCTPLLNLCIQEKVPVFLDQKMGSSSMMQILKDFSPDINIVATFNQKIPESIASLPRMGSINIHPSILPNYRGPTPTNWAIINGEKEAGITFQLIGCEYDMGDILYQKRLKIGNKTDGQLRESLAILAGNLIGEFLRKYICNQLKPVKQEKTSGSYYPKVSSQQGLEIIKAKNYPEQNIIKGLTPFPGIGILDEENHGI